MLLEALWESPSRIDGRPVRPPRNGDVLRGRILIVLIASLGLLVSSPIGFAEDSKRSRRTGSDAAVMNHLFGDDTFQENAEEVLQRIDELPLEEQYQELVRWVLPADGHGIRIGGVIGRLPSEVADVAIPRITALVDFPESSWIRCPVRELVAVSERLGCKPVLKNAITGLQPGDDGQQLAHVTFLTLLEISDGDRELVEQRLADRFDKIRSSHDANSAELAWTDLLVLWAAVENPQTASLVIEDFFGTFANLRSNISYPKLDLLTDYLSLLRGFVAAQAEPSSFSLPENFDVFSRFDAQTHGCGNVLARFVTNDLGVSKLSGHELDYLAYRSPLSGDYEVVADVATQGGAFSELVVDGIAARPSEDLQSASIGSFAKGNWLADVPKPFEPFNRNSFLRAVASDRTIEHFFNGRSLFVDTAETSSAPWVAIRGWRRSVGDVSDFRIAGNPTIPRSIDLLARFVTSRLG